MSSNPVKLEDASNAMKSIHMLPEGQTLVRYIIENICGYYEGIVCSDMHKTLVKAVKVDVANEILKLLD